MILAELEVFHSRPIAPTRRIALGQRDLPVDPAPGFGGLLLAGLVAASIVDVDPEIHADLATLTVQLEAGRRIPQPRLRHRLQVDHVGLNRHRHRLRGDGERLSFDLDLGSAPTPSVLAALYAAGQLPPEARPRVLGTLRAAMAWRGPLDASLVDHLRGPGAARGWTAIGGPDPVGWALQLLGLEAARAAGASTEPSERPERAVIQRRFRELLREAHPDHGGEATLAAQRIADLTEARRILLAG